MNKTVYYLAKGGADDGDEDPILYWSGLNWLYSRNTARAFLTEDEAIGAAYSLTSDTFIVEEMK